MTTIKEELENSIVSLGKAAKSVTEKFTQAAAALGRIAEPTAFAQRIKALPPNIRELVLCGMVYLESAERYVDHHGDITDWQLFELKDAYAPSPILAEELKPLRVLKPQSIKQIPKGIPWNKKRDFKRPK